MTDANFEDTVDWWRVVLDDFKTNVVSAAPDVPDAGGPQQDEDDIRL